MKLIIFILFCCLTPIHNNFILFQDEFNRNYYIEHIQDTGLENFYSINLYEYKIKNFIGYFVIKKIPKDKKVYLLLSKIVLKPRYQKLNLELNIFNWISLYSGYARVCINPTILKNCNVFKISG